MPRLTTTPTRRGDEGRDDYRRYKLTTENESTAQIPEPNRGADHILPRDRDDHGFQPARLLLLA